MACGDPAAGDIAQELIKLGAQSLGPLMPRGTLCFSAGDRWDSHLTDDVLGIFTALPFAVPLAAATVKVLGYFAGGGAVGGIQGAMLRCANAGRPSGAESDTLISGLYALHMIGGPKAVSALREFQSERHPAKIRERAHWYLNELGSPTVDLQFGSDELTENLTAADVLSRNKLPD